MRFVESILLIASLTAFGCSANLDGFVFNGTHCSEVGPATCEDEDDPWNKRCTPCDEPYDFGKDYPWQDGTFDGDVDTVRPIDPALVTQFEIPTVDGEGVLDAYHIEAHGDDPELAQVTLLYNHGNFGSLEHYMPRMRFLHEAGYAIFAWDFRGYGKTSIESHPSSAQFVEDARTVWDFSTDVVANAEYRVPYSHSLGTIPAVEMGLHDEPCAIFLESPFTGTSRMAESNSGMSIPGAFLSEGHFENTEKIERYDGPLLVMHGAEDRTFSVDGVTELYEAAPGPKELWLLDGAGHGISGGGIPEAGLEAYFDKMKGFLVDKGACGR